MQQNLEFDNDMKKLSLSVYGGKQRFAPADWIRVGIKNSKNGFHGEAFYKDNVIALVFRGQMDQKII